MQNDKVGAQVILKSHGAEYICHKIKPKGKENNYLKIQNNDHFGEQDFPGGSDGKASVYTAGDLGSIPGSGRSPGEGNGNLLQYYCLENPMDRGAWQATVHGVAKSWAQLCDFTHSLTDSMVTTGKENTGRTQGY